MGRRYDLDTSSSALGRMKRNHPIVVALVGFLLLVLGYTCSWEVFPRVIKHFIHKSIILTEGSVMYTTWKKQPFPMKFKIYMFNVSNPDEVQLGAQPQLKEVGPYVYDEYRERIDISASQENDSLRYILKRYFYFNQKESLCHTEDDMITIINAGLVGTAIRVYTMMPSALSTVNDAVPYMYPDAKDIFIRAKIKDVLFNGILVSCSDEEVEFICGAMKGMLPPTLRFHPNGRDFLFSMFSHLNNTDDGPYTISRGIEDHNTRGDILTYHDLPKMDIWGGPNCNMLNGSDSTLFYSLESIPDRIYIFSSELCRSTFVKFEQEMMHRGLKVWKFVNTNDSLGDTDENKCFCPTGKDDDFNDVIKCPSNGLLDLSPCMKAPVLACYPHFYLSDPELLSYSTGLKPDKDLHQSYLIIEPKTATPIEGAKRIQMNIPVKRFEEFTLLNNVSEGVFPILWLEEVVVLPDELVNQVKEGLGGTIYLDIAKWSMIVMGVILMLGAFIWIMYRERLLCFSSIPMGKVGISDVKPAADSSNVGPITEINFNDTSLYRELYPQMDNKNISDRLIRRPTAVNSEAWNLKN